MILLWLALIVSSVHSESFIGHIANYSEYYNYCITNGTENRTSWLVAIHNLDTGKHFNGALISDRHLLTIKDAVTSIKDGVERVTNDFASQLDLQAVTDDHKLVTLKAKHIVIPVRYSEQTEKIDSLHDLAIVELDAPAPDGINFVCPNGRMHNTPNYPSCKGTERIIYDVCGPLVKGYRFFTYTRTLNDTTWGSNDVPWPDHSNFTRFCVERECNVRPIIHNYLNQSEGGDQGRAGDVFVSGTLSHWNDTLHGLTVDQMGFAQLHGLGINETSVINLNVWEPFICEHTGVCSLGMYRPSNPRGDPVLRVKEAASSEEKAPFLLDDALVLKRCTTEHKEKVSTMSLEKTNRLNESEYHNISVNCGRKEDHEEWPVSILRPSESFFSDAVQICTGSFISRRHVITAKSCVIPHMHQSLIIRYGPKKPKEGFWRSLLAWIFREKDYYETKVQFVIYPGRNGTGSEIAVLELTESIKTTNNSMIMCLPLRDGWARGYWYETFLLVESVDLFTMQWLGYGNRNDSVTAHLFKFGDLLKSTVKSKYGNTDLGSPLVFSYLTKAHDKSGPTTLWAVTTDPSASSFLVYVQKNIGLVCRMSGVCPGGSLYLKSNEKTDIYANGKRLDCE